MENYVLLLNISSMKCYEVIKQSKLSEIDKGYIYQRLPQMLNWIRSVSKSWHGDKNLLISKMPIRFACHNGIWIYTRASGDKKSFHFWAYARFVWLGSQQMYIRLSRVWNYGHPVLQIVGVIQSSLFRITMQLNATNIQNKGRNEHV